MANKLIAKYMDEQNQMQNPGMSPMVGQAMDHVTKKKGHWLLIGVLIAVLVAFFFVWGYMGMIDLASIPSVPAPITRTDSDQQLNNEIENINLGDTDAEFQAIDQDLNSL